MIASLMIGITSFGIRYSFGIFFNSFESEFGTSRTATSGIFAAHMILCGVFSIIGGWALDKFGPRKVTLAMGLFTGLSLLLSSQVSSPWQLYITYSVLLAVGTGALFSTVNTTTTRWFVKNRGLAVGITSAAGAIGQVFMAPFSTFLISHFDWRQSFIILGILAWVILLPMSFLMKRDPSDIGLLPDGVKPAEGALSPVAGKQKTDEGLTLFEAWKVREFWYLTSIWLVLSMSVHMVITHAPPHAMDLGISPINAALIISLIGIGSILGRIVDGRLSDSIGRKHPAVISAIIMIAALIAIIFIRETWMFFVFAVFYGWSWGGLGSQVTLLIGDIFGIRSLGLIMGVISMGWSIGAAIGPTMGGMAFDTTGTYSGAFAIAAGSTVLSVILVILIRPEKAVSRSRLH